MKNQPVHVASYHKGHPNPQRYRENYESWNGAWNFAFDEANEGLLRHYEREFPAGTKIVVPYPYQSAASGINLPDKQCDVVWYEKEFAIDSLDQAHIVTFSGVDYLTTVFVNGKYVMTHEGGYDAFTVDVTPYVSVGKNKITLRVEDTMAIDQVRGKQRWRKDSFTCFYTETSGIVRDVYIEHRNKAHIKDFTLKTDFCKKTLTVCAEAPKGSMLAVRLSDADGRTVFEQSFAMQCGTDEFVLNAGDVRAWSHEDPYLYNVELTLFADGKEVDKVYSYCGFTTVELRGNRIFWNGRDTYLKFVLNQNYWLDTITTPTEEEIIEDARLTLACGFNGARMHEHIPSPLNFYYMDLLGLYAWQECPSAHGYSYKANKQYFAQFPRMIREHFSHPCIMAYVLWNESWGVNEIGESDEIRQMTAQMYEKIKAISNGRLVISNDGWEHTVSDAITFHNYADTKEELRSQLNESLKAIAAGENAECVQGFKKFFAGDYRYGGQAIMFSEFAGIAFAKDDQSGWGYGKSVGTARDFLEKYKGMLDFIAEHKEMCGFCMTQLTDVYQEKNGLFTMDRKEKVPVEEIRKLHEKFC